MAIVDAKSQEYFARWPEGNADYYSLAYAASNTLEARNSKQIYKFAAITGDLTIILATTFTLEPQSVPKNIERFVGDEIILYVTDDGSASDIVFSTGITGADYTMTASKTVMVSLVYVDSTIGYVVKSIQQID